MKMIAELLKELAPDMELRVVERAKFEGKEWFGVLVREKAKEDERS